MAIAADHGVSRVIADTALDNIASQRTLNRVGFRFVRTDGELHHYDAVSTTDPVDTFASVTALPDDRVAEWPPNMAP